METKIQNRFIWQSTVRDYELDSQGIVNNATYVNYFEQCRNDYARALGIDVQEYFQAGYNLIVAGIEVQYRFPLSASEKFYVTANISQHNEKRIYFEQEIRRETDDKLIATAIVTTACVDHKTGKSCMPTMLKEKLPTIETPQVSK